MKTYLNQNIAISNILHGILIHDIAVCIIVSWYDKECKNKKANLSLLLSFRFSGTFCNYHRIFSITWRFFTYFLIFKIFGPFG